MSETFDPLVGAALAGRYLIVRRIGEGGMGAVYEAKHTVIGKRVTLGGWGSWKVRRRRVPLRRVRAPRPRESTR